MEYSSIDQEETKKRVSCKDEDKLLGDITELLSFHSEKDIQAMLKEFLQKAKRFAGVDLLCIYHARANNLGFTKLAAIEKEKAFPKSVNLEELNFQGRICLWRQGELPFTRLQNYAQETGMEYLLISRLTEGEGVLGLISAGGFKTGNLPLISKRLEVVSGLLASLLQRYILEMYLKNQNENLKNSLRKYDQVIQNTKDAVIIVDRNLKVMEINQTAENILGYTFKEIEKSPISDVLIGADGLMEAMEIALAGIETHEMGIVSLHRRDAQAVSAHIRAMPINNEKNKLQGILILISDENENEQNRIKVQHLEQRAALGSLASIFSHEVKNPINNIWLGVQLMQSWTEEDDRNYEPLNRMAGDCSRLKELTESILSYSRPVEPNWKPINMVNQLSTMLDRWRPRFERLHIESNPLFPDKPLTIKGDTRMLDQIFTNLINNAADAMEKTGGTLTIKIRRDDEYSEKPQVEIAVADTGPGMSDEWMDKVFQPFKTTKAKGTGLGLAITKNLVTILHGTIQVESFNVGCVFTVRFPLFMESNP